MRQVSKAWSKRYLSRKLWALLLKRDWCQDCDMRLTGADILRLYYRSWVSAFTWSSSLRSMSLLLDDSRLGVTCVALPSFGSIVLNDKLRGGRFSWTVRVEVTPTSIQQLMADSAGTRARSRSVISASVPMSPSSGTIFTVTTGRDRSGSIQSTTVPVVPMSPQRPRRSSILSGDSEHSHSGAAVSAGRPRSDSFTTTPSTGTTKSGDSNLSSNMVIIVGRSASPMSSPVAPAKGTRSRSNSIVGEQGSMHQQLVKQMAGAMMGAPRQRFGSPQEPRNFSALKTPPTHLNSPGVQAASAPVSRRPSGVVVPSSDHSRSASLPMSDIASSPRSPGVTVNQPRTPDSVTLTPRARYYSDSAVPSPATAPLSARSRSPSPVSLHPSSYQSSLHTPDDSSTDARSCTPPRHSLPTTLQTTPRKRVGTGTGSPASARRRSSRGSSDSQQSYRSMQSSRRDSGASIRSDRTTERFQFLAGIISGAMHGFDAPSGAPVNKHHCEHYWIISYDGYARSRSDRGTRMSELPLGGLKIGDGDQITFILDLTGTEGELQILLNKVPIYRFLHLPAGSEFRPVVSLSGEGSLRLIRSGFM